MKLYEYIDERHAYECLRSEKIEDAIVNAPHVFGSVSPIRELKIHTPRGLVEFRKDVVEFELCWVGATFMGGRCVPVPNGKPIHLVAVSIFPGCRMGWEFVRSCVKKNIPFGENVIIKIMKTYRDYSMAPVIVDEEYRTDSQGLYCLKYNKNHPSVRDVIRVADV